MASRALTFEFRGEISKFEASTKRAREQLEKVGDATGKASRSWDKLTDTVEKFNVGQFGVLDRTGAVINALAGAGGMAAAAIVAGVAVSKLVDSVKVGIGEIEEMEIATAKLNAVFQGNAGAINRVMAAVDKLNQSQPFFEDDQLANAAAGLKLFGLTEKQIHQLLPVITDLSAVMGADLDSAVQRVGMGLTGQTRSLRQWGIVIKEGADKQTVFNAVMDKASMFQTAASERANTLAGKYAQLGKDVKDASVAIAERLNPALETTVSLASSAAIAASDMVTALMDLSNVNIPKWATDFGSPKTVTIPQPGSPPARGLSGPDITIPGVPKMTFDENGQPKIVTPTRKPPVPNTLDSRIQSAQADAIKRAMAKSLSSTETDLRGREAGLKVMRGGLTKGMEEDKRLVLIAKIKGEENAIAALRRKLAKEDQQNLTEAAKINAKINKERLDGEAVVRANEKQANDEEWDALIDRFLKEGEERDKLHEKAMKQAEEEGKRRIDLVVEAAKGFDTVLTTAAGEGRGVKGSDLLSGASGLAGGLTTQLSSSVLGPFAGILGTGVEMGVDRLAFSAKTLEKAQAGEKISRAETAQAAKPALNLAGGLLGGGMGGVISEVASGVMTHFFGQQDEAARKQEEAARIQEEAARASREAADRNREAAKAIAERVANLNKQFSVQAADIKLGTEFRNLENARTSGAITEEQFLTQRAGLEKKGQELAFGKNIDAFAADVFANSNSDWKNLVNQTDFANAAKSAVEAFKGGKSIEEVAGMTTAFGGNMKEIFSTEALQWLQANTGDQGAALASIDASLKASLERGTEQQPLVIQPPRNSDLAFATRSSLMGQRRGGASRSLAGNVRTIT